MGISENRESLRLQVLGGLSISANGTTLNGTVARRRSLALLALVAAAGEGGVSDEHALAALWPDLDTTRARNNLKQVAFTLRQALGRDAFLRTATTLRLDTALFSVDRWDFEKAVVDGDADKAISQYAGPFLAGFHIAGLAEFERWVEAERSRLAQIHVDALTSVAMAACAAGDHLGAAAWWRQIATQDPLNEVSAQRFICALAASGDTAGALQYARVHENLLAQELDLRPSPAFQRCVADIRAGLSPTNGISPRPHGTTAPFSIQAIAMAASVRSDPPPSPAVSASTFPAAASSATAPETVSVTPTSPRTILETRSERFRRAWSTRERRIAGFTTRFTKAAAAFVAVATLGTFAVLRSEPLREQNSGLGSAVVVVPFTVNAGSGSANLGSVVSELLAAGMDGSLGLRVLAVGWTERRVDSAQVESPVARRASARRLAGNVGASLYVSGDVFESGDRIRITAEFRTRQDEAPLERAVMEGTRAELFDLVDRVASRLIASRIDGGRREVVRVASVTTSSLAAAKAYFRGEEALTAGGFRAAIDFYEEALELDSTFALAYYGLSTAADLLGDSELVREAASQALRYARRLPSRQKRLLTAFVARQQGDVAGAKRLYSQLTADYPADADAWMGLGETLFHLNPLRGQEVSEARFAFEHAAALDPKNTSAFAHLARIAALDDDQDRSRRMVARARSLAPDLIVARFAVHVMSLGVPLDDAVAGTVTNRTDVTQLPAVDAVSLLMRAGTDDLLRFARRLGSGSVREYGLRLQSHVEAGGGRLVRALALLDTCSVSNRILATEARSRLVALSFIPIDTGEINRVRSELRDWTPDNPEFDPVDSVTHGIRSYLRLHRLGLLALRLSDTVTVNGLAQELDAMGHAAPNNLGPLLSKSLRAHLAARAGRSREALALLESTDGARVASATPLEPYDRLLHAQLLEQGGRGEEALGYYAQLGRLSPFELPLQWQAELGIARIYAGRGERALAVQYYERVAARLRDADPPLRGARDEAAQLAADLRGR